MDYVQSNTFYAIDEKIRETALSNRYLHAYAMHTDN